MPGERKGIARSLFDAEEKRAEATDQKVGFKTPKRGAQANLRLLQRFPARAGFAGGQDTGGHVTMAVEVFRSGMENNVSAKRERLADRWRGTGRINDENCTRRMGGIGCGPDVDHIPGGIHRRFNPDDGGFAGDDGAGQAGGIGGVKQIDADIAHGLLAQHPGLHPVIHDSGGSDALAGFYSFNKGRCGPHARCEETGFKALLQFAEQAFGMGHGGRTVARIDVVPHKAVILLAGKGGGRLDGGDYRAGLAVDEVAGLGDGGADGRFRIRAVRHAGRR